MITETITPGTSLVAGGDRNHGLSWAVAHGTIGRVPPLAHILNVYRDRVPPAFLPIADDLAGNLICLGVTGTHQGQVYFWDHELEAEEGDPPTMDNMELIAKSFDELLDRIIVRD